MELLQVTRGNIYFISEDIDAARTLADAVRAEMGDAAARYLEMMAADIETLSADMDKYYQMEYQLIKAQSTISDQEKDLEKAYRKISMLVDRIDTLEKALIKDPIPFN